MLDYPKIRCQRGLETCRAYGQVVQNDDTPMAGSFFCCGKNDGTMAPVKEDRYTICFHGEFRDTMSFNDRRDLVDKAHVILAALSHIELDLLLPAANP